MGPEAATKIGVRDWDVFEYVTMATAPLRAWARIASSLPSDAVPLGPMGRAMLNLEAGGEVWARALPVGSGQTLGKLTHESGPAI